MMAGKSVSPGKNEGSRGEESWGFKILLDGIVRGGPENIKEN